MVRVEFVPSTEHLTIYDVVLELLVGIVGDPFLQGHRVYFFSFCTLSILYRFILWSISRFLHRLPWS
ncbi:hypothetical protein FKM82_024716 [Ascaphus truei]